MDIDKSNEVVTFEEVKHKLENKKLENYSKQDVGNGDGEIDS